MIDSQAWRGPSGGGKVMPGIDDRELILTQSLSLLLRGIKNYDCTKRNPQFEGCQKKQFCPRMSMLFWLFFITIMAERMGVGNTGSVGKQVHMGKQNTIPN